MAKKKNGKAKDDYSSKFSFLFLIFISIGFSLQSNVKKTNCELYSLSCFSSAFIRSSFQPPNKVHAEQSNLQKIVA